MHSTFFLQKNCDGSLTFRGCVDPVDLTKVRLDPFDRAVLDDCGDWRARDGRTAADLLLGLELLYRRMLEQRV